MYLNRFRTEDPRFGTLVTDSHNDQDYSDPGHPASQNLELILRSIGDFCGQMEMIPVGITLDALCELVLKDKERST